jgi:hypothetical protein
MGMTMTKPDGTKDVYEHIYPYEPGANLVGIAWVEGEPNVWALGNMAGAPGPLRVTRPVGGCHVLHPEALHPAASDDARRPHRPGALKWCSWADRFGKMAPLRCTRWSANLARSEGAASKVDNDRPRKELT